MPFVRLSQRASKDHFARGTAALCMGAAGLYACGGETLAASTNGGGPTGYDPCAESAALERAMIADFEAPPAVSWFTGSDGTAPADLLSPLPPGVFTTPLDLAKCPEDATPGSAFQIIASGLRGYGYTFGFNMLNMLPDAGGANYFDASSWDGLSLWVRKGSADSSSSFFASVSERFTDPAGAGLFTPQEMDLLLDNGAYCAFDALDVNGDGTADPLLSQCDRFGVGIGISTEWRFFKIPFSRMSQRAFGRPSAEAEVDRRILGLDFSLDGERWDFWIDDIAFYRHRPAADAMTSPE